MAINQDQQRLNDRVVATAERFEDEINSVDDIDPLEVYFEVSADGTVKEAIAVLEVGGPKIEVRLFSGTVSGYWGSDKHTVPIFKNEDAVTAIGEYYARTFEENIIA